MDTKTYIKMCEADNDLQWDDKSYKLKYGDYRPEQEQIQEVLFQENSFYDTLLKFVEFINDEYCHFSMLAEKGTEDKYKDFNELWFAFVMKEKYNKVWNGNKWVTLKRISVK